MSEDNNPREFWIEVKSFSSQFLVVHEERPDRVTCRIAREIIHVVDYYYFDKAKSENEKLKKQNGIMREALVEASEYQNTDDCNGNAGDIAATALKKIGEVE